MHGNLWLSAGDGVHCHAPDGTLLGKILIPETVANVCFGGAKLNRLFICGTTSLYAVYLNTRGARPRAALSVATVARIVTAARTASSKYQLRRISMTSKSRAIAGGNGG